MPTTKLRWPSIKKLYAFPAKPYQKKKRKGKRRSPLTLNCARSQAALVPGLHSAFVFSATSIVTIPFTDIAGGGGAAVRKKKGCLSRRL